jgi:hypothetical protein
MGRRHTGEYNRTAEENGWVLEAYAEDSIQLTKDEPAKSYKQSQQDVLDQWVMCIMTAAIRLC